MVAAEAGSGPFLGVNMRAHNSIFLLVWNLDKKIQRHLDGDGEVIMCLILLFGSNFALANVVVVQQLT